MKMMTISFDQAKKSFFNRRAVTGAVDRKKRKVYSKFGAFVRRRARSSMKPARQKSLGEMSQDELIVYEQKKRFAAQHGGPTPRRPRATSKPGEPPRVIKGLLKQFLFFAYDQSSDSVVIGPAKLNGKSNAPEVLEYGGSVDLKNGRSGHVKARPYMRPAFAEEVANVPYLWAGALDGV